MNTDEDKHYQAYIEAMELLRASLAVVAFNTNTRTVERLLVGTLALVLLFRTHRDAC
tara:strand:- start:858 stop:1028 length:171 start_codon:yes stop_codon:yes gene_type:complete